LKENEFAISNLALADLIETLISRKKSLRFTAKGFSMFPLICNNDVVTLSPISDSCIGLGQVVAFLCPKNQSLAIHRIIGRKTNGYIIKGDNTFATDGVIPRKNILAYVSMVERKGKRITLGLGKERQLIVFLSRAKVLPSLSRIGRLMPRPIKKFLNEKLF
jgi:hypothetical protein